MEIDQEKKAATLDRDYSQVHATETAAYWAKGTVLGEGYSPSSLGVPSRAYNSISKKKRTATA